MHPPFPPVPPLRKRWSCSRRLPGCCRQLLDASPSASVSSPHCASAFLHHPTRAAWLQLVASCPCAWKWFDASRPEPQASHRLWLLAFELARHATRPPHRMSQSHPRLPARLVPETAGQWGGGASYHAGGVVGGRCCGHCQSPNHTAQHRHADAPQWAATACYPFADGGEYGLPPLHSRSKRRCCCRRQLEEPNDSPRQHKPCCLHRQRHDSKV